MGIYNDYIGYLSFFLALQCLRHKVFEVWSSHMVSVNVFFARQDIWNPFCNPFLVSSLQLRLFSWAVVFIENRSRSFLLFILVVDLQFMEEAFSASETSRLERWSLSIQALSFVLYLQTNVRNIMMARWVEICFFWKAHLCVCDLSANYHQV